MVVGVSGIPTRMVLAFACLALTLILVSASDEPPPQSCTATLTQVAEMETEGNSGFEVWVHNNDIRLFAANLWDGVSPSMASGSWIYNVSGTEAGTLEVKKLQRIPTMGATQAKYVRGFNGRDMVMINNYMKCGYKELALSPNRPPCGPTSVYVSDGPEWVDFKSLRTLGPTKSEYMYVGGAKLWITIVEAFTDSVSLWDYEPANNQFERKAKMTAAGASDAVPTVIDDTLYISIASKANANGGNASQVTVFALVEGELMQVQSLPCFGSQDLDTVKFNGDNWLFVANERTDETVEINSHIYKYEKSMWKGIQDIPTDGARGGQFFVLGKDLWLGVANFGDMMRGRVEAKSTLWKLNKATGLFEEKVSVNSFGATGWKSFTLNGHHYVALANQGHLTAKKWQTSYVYRLDETCVDGVLPSPLLAEGKKAEL